jgi:hypothetical protein
VISLYMVPYQQTIHKTQHCDMSFTHLSLYKYYGAGLAIFWYEKPNSYLCFKAFTSCHVPPTHVPSFKPQKWVVLLTRFSDISHGANRSCQYRQITSSSAIRLRTYVARTGHHMPPSKAIGAMMSANSLIGITHDTSRIYEILSTQRYPSGAHM